jgi:hypothetical protein
VPGGAPAPSRMAASGAAVPPVRTLTATVAPAARGTAPQNRPTAPTRRPSATRYAGSTRQALTSFIITCRINPHAASLIPAGLPAPHPPAGAVSVRKRTGAHAAQSPDEPSVLDENGDDSANP